METCDTLYMYEFSKVNSDGKGSGPLYYRNHVLIIVQQTNKSNCMPSVVLKFTRIYLNRQGPPLILKIQQRLYTQNTSSRSSLVVVESWMSSVWTVWWHKRYEFVLLCRIIDAVTNYRFPVCMLCSNLVW